MRCRRITMTIHRIVSVNFNLVPILKWICLWFSIYFSLPAWASSWRLSLVRKFHLIQLRAIVQQQWAKLWPSELRIRSPRSAIVWLSTAYATIVLRTTDATILSLWTTTATNCAQCAQGRALAAGQIQIQIGSVYARKTADQIDSVQEIHQIRSTDLSVIVPAKASIEEHDARSGLLQCRRRRRRWWWQRRGE